MDIWADLFNFIALISVAIIIGLMLERLKQSAILGFLLTGIVLGPGGFFIIGSTEEVAIFAELGVALLLFMIGLEFSFRKLMKLGVVATGGGSLQIILTVIVVGIICMFSGLNFRESLALGLIIAPSSTACVLQVLKERSEIESIHGRNSLGILLFQDAALVPMVVVLSSIGGTGGAVQIFTGLGKGFGLMILLIIGILLVSKYLLPHVLSQTSLAKNRELPLLLSVSIALSATWLAHKIGLSPALGAFAAGVILAESPYAVQIRSDISALKTIFVTIFFASIGMMADISWAAKNILPLILVVTAMICIKGAVVFAVIRFFKQKFSHSLATALCLAQAGEFSFVLAGVASSAGIIAPKIFKFYISASITTLFLTPFLVAASARIVTARRIKDVDDLEKNKTDLSSSKLENHIPVFGYGPAGRIVCGALMESGANIIVVDLNPQTIKILLREGISATIGDASSDHLLEEINIGKAKAAVITIPDHRAALNALKQIKAHSPDLPVIVRARNSRFAGDIEKAGGITINEEEETGKSLAGKILDII